MLPQMLTGDLDSSLANLASNLDFGNGAKKWGNCFLILVERLPVKEINPKVQNEFASIPFFRNLLQGGARGPPMTQVH